MNNLEQKRSSRKKLITKKYIKGSLIAKRHKLDTKFDNKQDLYEVFPWMKKIVCVRINNVEIPVKIMKFDKKRFLDVSSYIANYPDVKSGIISIWVDTK